MFSRFLHRNKKLGIVEELVDLGAYLVSYSPKKSMIYVWFKKDVFEQVDSKVAEILGSYSIIEGKNGNFIIVNAQIS